MPSGFHFRGKSEAEFRLYALRIVDYSDTMGSMIAAFVSFKAKVQGDESKVEPGSTIDELNSL